jgi:hypothetical protein
VRVKSRIWPPSFPSLSSGKSSPSPAVESAFRWRSSSRECSRRRGVRHARAVAGVMSDAVTRGELTDVFSQLPGDFGDLFTAKSV